MKTTGILLVMVLLMGVAFTQNAYSYTNMDIGAEAGTYDTGDPGGTCKEFLQKIITDIRAEYGTGTTSPELGSGYQKCYTDAGKIISEDQATYGDIIQVSNDKDANDTSHVHTAIILQNLGNGVFRVKHSNWEPAFEGLVHTDDKDFEAWATEDKVNNTTKKPGADTNPDYDGFHAHYYRLGAGAIGIQNNSSQPTIATVSDAFNNAFHIVEESGQTYYAQSYLHSAYSTYVQDLCKDNVGIGGTCPTGKDAILMWNVSTNSVFLLKEGFWGLWKLFGGLTDKIKDSPYEDIGYPESSEKDPDPSTGWIYQDFQKGVFSWHPSENKIYADLHNGKTYRFWWSSSTLWAECVSGCPRPGEKASTGSYSVQTVSTSETTTSTTVADHYLWGAPYTGPTYNPDITYFLKGGKVYQLEVTEEGDVYALTNQIASGSGYTNGYLYVSHDQGLSWELVTSNVDHFSIYPYASHTFVLGKDSKHYLFKGDTYTSIGNCTKDCEVVFWTENAYFMARDGYGTEEVTYKNLQGSSQGGWGYGASIYPSNSAIYSGGRNLGDFGYSYGPGTWYRIITNMEGTVDVANVPTDSTSFYVLAETGEVWKVSTSSRSASYKGRVPFSYRNDHGQILYPATSLAVNPKNSNLLYATVSGVGGLWRSTNGGSSWAQVEAINEASDCSVSPDGSLVYIANAEGGNTSGISVFEEPSIPLP